MENWRTFILDEAMQGQLVPRQVERELSRAVMFDVRDKIGSGDFADWMANPSALKPSWYGMADNAAVKAPKLVANFGLDDIEVFIRPMKPGMIATGMGPIYVGGDMSAAGTTIVDVGKAGKALFYPQSSTKYRVMVFYNPEVIKTPADFRRHLSDISSGIKKNVAHELTHHKQYSTDSPHKSKYEFRPGEEVPEKVDPKKAVWQKDNPAKFPRRSEGALYLLSRHETQAHVRGFYKQAQKSKGRYTFEQLVDERIKLAIQIEDITPEEAPMVKKHWMDHAHGQLPCAKLLNGAKINPKGCVRLKRGTKFLEHPDVKGRVKASVTKKVGAALIVGAVLWFLLEDVANAAETYGPPSLENYDIYGKIFATHGISVIDPTGVIDIVMGLYDILSAEDPKKASRAVGSAMGEMFGILPTSTTKTSFKWPWEKQTQASQEAHPMHPIGGLKDPRYQPGQPASRQQGGRDCWTTTPVAGFPKCPDWESAVKRPLNESKRITIYIKRK